MKTLIQLVATQNLYVQHYQNVLNHPWPTGFLSPDSHGEPSKNVTYSTHVPTSEAKQIGFQSGVSLSFSYAPPQVLDLVAFNSVVFLLKSCYMLNSNQILGQTHNGFWLVSLVSTLSPFPLVSSHVDRAVLLTVMNFINPSSLCG